jgi:hypothetical protein
VKYLLRYCVAYPPQRPSDARESGRWEIQIHHVASAAAVAAKTHLGCDLDKNLTHTYLAKKKGTNKQPPVSSGDSCWTYAVEAGTNRPPE